MRRSEEVLLLGSYLPRYVDPLRAWAERLRAVGCRVAERYPDRWYAEDALTALAEPRELVVYFGHGVPGAWKGFGHLDAADLSAIDPRRSHGIVASLCCYSFTPDERGLDTGPALTDAGITECAVGYDGRIRHEENRRLLDQLFETYQNAIGSGADPTAAVAQTMSRESPVQTVGAPGRTPS